VADHRNNHLADGATLAAKRRNSFQVLNAKDERMVRQDVLYPVYLVNVRAATAPNRQISVPARLGRLHFLWASVLPSISCEGVA
jgi:hypothetical protein